MHMLKERMQILISTDQRRRLEREAQRRGTSVASVIRDAVDAQLGGVTVEDKRAALDEIRAMRGARFLTPEEINRIVEEERDAEAEEMLRRNRQ
jgi:hypothetical protein